jgi:MoxR-like ATPase
MQFPFYEGQGIQRSDSATSLPTPSRGKLLKPENYIADSGLRGACNVALLLGQPLILNGEPGTGKTQFAYSLAWELGLQTPLKFETKSNSTAQDLFYIYDALKRFQDIQSGLNTKSTLNYITYQALGLAILKSKRYEDVEDVLPEDFEYFEPQRSVVLIDEIDKAPRDFPNDLLNELEQLYFRVSELGNRPVEANPQLRPIVIITSNSEKDLPDAFLRRCVYYNIPFPERDKLTDILTSRLGLNVDTQDTFLQTALDLFGQLRSPGSGLRKKPATAELLGWISALRTFSKDGENPFVQREIIIPTLSSLIKTAEDQEKAQAIVEQWIKQQVDKP